MVRKQFFLYNEQYKFIKKLGGNFSEHIRYAIDDYIEKKKSKVSTSLSQKGGSNV